MEDTTALCQTFFNCVGTQYRNRYTQLYTLLPTCPTYLNNEIIHVIRCVYKVKC